MTAVGIDVGGTKVLAVRLEGTTIVAETSVKLDRSVRTTEAVLQAIDSVVDGTVRSIGIGVAGLVDHENGVLLWGPHVSGTRLKIRKKVAERYDVAVVVDNDANMAAYGELRIGAAHGYSNVLLVTLGTGIGGAIIMGGELYRGGGFAGEWGHVQIERDGLPCDCGKHGCWESRASGPALVRLARHVIDTNPDSSLARYHESQQISGESVVAAADSGDETARALVTEVGRSLGEGLASLAAIFDPELILVGGGLGSIGESIVGPARRVLTDSLIGTNLRVPPTVQVVTLGGAAGAVGAALLSDDEAV